MATEVEAPQFGGNVETVLSSSRIEPAPATLEEARNAPGRDDSRDSLAEREREIFQLIAEGHSNKAIADLLSVSPATVESHRAHILQKLDLHNAAELVLYAVRRGVIS